MSEVIEGRMQEAQMDVLSKGYAQLPNVLNMMGYTSLRPGQEPVIINILAQRDTLCILPTSCHAPGQLILMADGVCKNIEDIKKGEQVMGWDGTARTVTNTVHGFYPSSRIEPYKKDSFTVTNEHLLTLVRTNETNAYKYPCDKLGGSVIDVSVNDYNKWTKWRKHLYKLFSVPVTTFHRPEQPYRIAPYFMGVLLGDGSFRKDCPSVSKPDVEIEKECVKQAALWRLKLRKEGEDNNPTFYFHNNGKHNNPLRLELESLNLWGLHSQDKFIPEAYKYGSISSRREVLAGLLDTDGHLDVGGFDFISASKQLALDLVFVARSVGCYASIAECHKSCQNSYTGTFWRCFVSGKALQELPLKITRKIPSKTTGNKRDVLRSGFKVVAVGEKEFYGITISGDGRYLMGDFTVTHNTGKTACFVVPTICLNWRTIVFSPLVALMRDQVQGLNARGIKAQAVSSMQTDAENQAIIRRWAEGDLQFIYVAPERLHNEAFKEAMTRVPPDMVVMDECFTPDTEILTANGFVRFDQLQEGVPCAQFDAASENIDFVVPTSYICREHKGEMIRLQANKLCDLTMTPEHELVLRYKNGFKKEAVCKANLNHLKTLPAAGKSAYEGCSSLSTQERLLIAFQADGSFHTHKINGAETLSFTFTKSRKIDRFLVLMEEGKYKWSEVKTSRNRRRFLVFDTFNMSKVLSDNFILNEFSYSKAKAFIAEVVEWDGSKISDVLQYYSSVIKNNVDFVQAISVLAGYRTNAIVEKDNRKATFSDVHRLFINLNKTDIGAQSLTKTTIAHEGKVHCVRVPKGNIVVRSNGKVLITGNCHCLSQWSDNFRSSYCLVGDFIKEKNPKVVSAFTATCTSEVEADIRRVLHLQQAHKLMYYPRRANLILRSRNMTSETQVADFVSQVKGPVIVYCATINKVEQTTKQLNSWLREDVLSFHGELSPTDKRVNQDLFMHNKVRVMVATNAFGMGVDKGNIRAVVHRDIPGSMEALAQELGRAGRDGDESVCMSFYSPDSYNTQKFFIESSHPTRSEISNVLRVLNTAADSSGVSQLTISDIAKKTNLFSRKVPAVLETLKSNKVIIREKAGEKIGRIRLDSTIPEDDSRFEQWWAIIQEYGLEEDGFYNIDLNWFSDHVGLGYQTVMNHLKRWDTESAIRFIPPFRGSATKIIGSLDQIDFERLALKAALAHTKLEQVVAYIQTPDADKHAYLEKYFQVNK
jgi:superfamily II DNA helicase RecQ